MTELTQENIDQILDDFLGGVSAEKICRAHNITPTQLVELFNSSQRMFANNLFDDIDEPVLTLSQIEQENSELKGQHEHLNRKIKEYEIELRVHKEVLDTLLAPKGNRLKRL